MLVSVSKDHGAVVAVGFWPMAWANGKSGLGLAWSAWPSLVWNVVWVGSLVRQLAVLEDRPDVRHGMRRDSQLDSP